MPFDDRLELLPADDGVELLDANAVEEDDADAPLPFGRGWDFDFEIGRFVRVGAAPKPVRGVVQLQLWIEKVLRTARFAHPIYSDSFGVQMPDLYGQPFDPGIAAQLASAYTEALLVHDRIADVTDFTFAAEDEALYVSFRVVTDEDEDLEFEVPVVVD
jgi:phage baseplate assembly protein W